MAGKDVAAKATAADEPKKKSVARRLWRVARAVLYMLRRGVLATTYGRKLAMDLSLLLRRRGKVAGKVLAGLVSLHHHHQQQQHHYAAFSSAWARAGSGSGSGLSPSFSCRALDPALAVHEPSRGRRREVEFSCSNTPSSASAAGGFFGSSKRRGSSSRRRRHRDDQAATGYCDYDNCDAVDIARVFEMLNDDGSHLFDDDTLALATPSPAPLTSSSPFWRSPAAARQLRVTNSPFAATDNDAAAAGEQEQVDRKADEFIRRFYEQLRAQKSAAATPDYYGYAASSYSGHSPRPFAAGIA